MPDLAPLAPLVDLGERFLRAVEAHFRDHDVALPDRRYVTRSLPSYDDEQVTVRVVSIGLGVPGGQIPVGPTRPGAHPAYIRHAELQAVVIRKVPTVGTRGTPPSVDELTRSTQEGLTDMAVLHALAIRIIDGQELFARPARVQVGDVVGIDDSGGLGGVGLTVIVDVP